VSSDTGRGKKRLVVLQFVAEDVDRRVEDGVALAGA
jgi:hypothetical protein